MYKRNVDSYKTSGVNMDGIKLCCVHAMCQNKMPSLHKHIPNDSLQ